MTKVKRVLIMYEILKEGKEINLETFCNEYKISVPTFRRYMCLIRDFLWEKNLQEVVYDKNKKAYFIKK